LNNFAYKDSGYEPKNQKILKLSTENDKNMVLHVIIHIFILTFAADLYQIG